jgi:hypothetical protein
MEQLITTCPENQTDDVIYSNLDHKLDKNVAKFLKNHSDYYSQHSAWNFCGYVWFLDKKWYEEVWRYHSLEETLSDTNLVELIKEVNNKYRDE